MNRFVHGSKLFLRNHLWVRLIASKHPRETKHLWKVDVGITERGLDEIGDVTLVEKTIAKPQNNIKLNYGDEVLTINWDAHYISSADELYHTSWESISDFTVVKSPLGGDLVEIYLGDDTILDSDKPLFSILTNNECLQQRKGDFLHYDAYKEFVVSGKPGKFHDPDFQS